MPAGDKTGPMGQGPMTGRAAGYCVGNSAPGCMNSVGGRGRRRRGMGQGGGRGMGRGMGGGRGMGIAIESAGGQASFSGDVSQDELTALKQETEAMSRQMRLIQQRIQQLEQEKG